MIKRCTEVPTLVPVNVTLEKQKTFAEVTMLNPCLTGWVEP